MSKKILFIVGNYFPKASANGVCAQNLIDVYLEKGFETDVVCFRHTNVDTPKIYKKSLIYTVKPDLRLRLFMLSEDYKGKALGKFYFLLAKFFSYIKKILFLPLLPLNNFAFSKRFYKLISNLTNNKDYYGVVSILNPFEGNYALAKLKKQNKLKVPWVVFCVDTLVQIKGRVKNNPTKKNYRPPFWYKFFLSYCDGYLFMESRANEYKHNDLAKWDDKLYSADLPMLVTDSKKSNFKTVDLDDRVENFGYFGTIGGEHYPYKDLFDFFYSLPNDKKRTLHLFTRGASFCKEDFERSNEYKKIMIHGYVDSETLKSYIEKMDYLVSLKYSNNISAKIFLYISYKKPIIHFSGCKDDPDLRYLNKYPRLVLLNANTMTIEQMVERFNETILTNDIDSNLLLKLFEKNTPEYNVKHINDFFEKFWKSKE